MLDKKTLAAITKYVEQKFPEFLDSKPSVRVQQPPQPKNTLKTRPESKPQYLITYRATAQTSSGNFIPRLVRVVANVEGKIMKITTSR